MALPFQLNRTSAGREPCRHRVKAPNGPDIVVPPDSGRFRKPEATASDEPRSEGFWVLEAGDAG